MNPLQRAGAGISRAWGKSTRGTARTLNWMKDGIGDAFRGAGDKVRGLGSSDSADGKPAPKATASKTSTSKASTDSGPGLLDRIGLGGLARRAREDRRVAILELAVGLLVALWLAWTVYVWSENGSTAGLGVLISWPAVLAILALIAAPFVGAGVLVRRMANGDGSVAVVDAPTTGVKDEAKAEKAESKAKKKAKDEKAEAEAMDEKDEAEAEDEEAAEDEAEAEDEEAGDEGGEDEDAGDDEEDASEGSEQKD